MKAIILARVSTEDQIIEGQSIPAQLEKARQYTQRKNLVIRSEYQFDESSLKDRRVKFEQIIEEIKASKEPLALVVETIDRLQRSFKESVLLDEFRKQGKLEIHFIRENLVIHKDSNSSELQRWDLGVFMARSFVLQISDNVKRTIEHKLRNGEWPGRALFGYDNITNEDGKAWIAPNPIKSKIVIKLYEWYATGAFSMGQLVGKVKKEFCFDLPKGRIDFILKNPFYYGHMLPKQSGKLYPHKYQTIISKQLFDQVQSVKAGHRKQPFKYAGLPYLYRGLIRCANCGCLFTPEKKTKKSGRQYVYYHCTQHKGKCGSKWVKEEALTAQFKAIIDDIAVPKPILEEIYKTLKESHQGKVKYHNELQSELQAEYDKYQNRIEKMYEDRIDKRITDDFYDKKCEEYRLKQEEIQSRLGNLQQADEDYYTTAKQILRIAGNAPEIFKSSEPETKRQLLKVLFQNPQIKDVTLDPAVRKPFSIFSKRASRHKWRPWLI